MQITRTTVILFLSLTFADFCLTFFFLCFADGRFEEPRDIHSARFVYCYDPGPPLICLFQRAFLSCLLVYPGVSCVLTCFSFDLDQDIAARGHIVGLIKRQLLQHVAD